MGTAEQSQPQPKRFGQTAAGKTPQAMDERLPSLSELVGKEVLITHIVQKDRSSDGGTYYVVTLKTRGAPRAWEVATSGRIVSKQLRDLLAAHDLPVIAWVRQAANRTLYLADEQGPTEGDHEDHP